MAELQRFPVHTTSGRSGYVLRASRFLDRNQSNHVQLDDGTEFDVSSNALHVRPDGSFLLEDGSLNNAPADNASAPMPEQLPERIETAESTNGQGAIEPVDEPLFVEDVSVERVPINRIIDGPMDTRREGDVTIIPVIEEVFTVQKRLMLREEVRVTRKRTMVREPRRIVVSEPSA
jgi:hypothetical protein